MAARVVADALAKTLGQPVLADNKPGAQGALAAQALSAAPADGYTLLFAGASMFALPAVTQPAPFDALADFAPVSTVCDTIFGLFVHPGIPARSPGELLEYARAHPGKLNYASVSLAMDATMSLIFKAGGPTVTRVPYKGGPEAIADVIGGRVQLFFGPIGNGLAQARDGQLRLLASYPQRSPLAPEAPTLAEAGIVSERLPMFQMIVAPARTPRDVVERLSREINGVLGNTELRAQFDKLGLLARGSTSEQAAAEVRDVLRAYGQFVRDSKPAEK